MNQIDYKPLLTIMMRVKEVNEIPLSYHAG
jgi:hypothetical protein